MQSRRHASTSDQNLVHASFALQSQALDLDTAPTFWTKGSPFSRACSSNVNALHSLNKNSIVPSSSYPFTSDQLNNSLLTLADPDSVAVFPTTSRHPTCSIEQTTDFKTSTFPIKYPYLTSPDGEERHSGFQRTLPPDSWPDTVSQQGQLGAVIHLGFWLAEIELSSRLNQKFFCKHDFEPTKLFYSFLLFYPFLSKFFCDRITRRDSFSVEFSIPGNQGRTVLDAFNPFTAREI